jgi:hypothetical protein
MLPHQSNPAFSRKGKLFFITSLEKHRDLSTLLNEIQFVFRNPQTREVVLYFKERFRPFPNIITPLACAIDHIRHTGRNVRVLETFDELEETGYLNVETFTPPEDGHLMPAGRVWKYETSDDVYQLLDHTVDFLARNLEWERGTLHALEWSLYEILDNVFQHAGVRAGFFMFQIQQQRRRLSYCVADQGCGIFPSLSNSLHKPTTAMDAITLAVKKGVTRDAKTNMGNGLWGATEIVARSKGQLTISSGGAALFFDRITGRAQSIPRVFVLDPDAPGTFLDAQVDASVQVQVSEMFDYLSSPVNLRIENLEGEDGAVRVALKKMKFGAGTRQSGNFVRVYTANLLNETTAPIVVDFTDVGIVSSSFADEFIAKLYAQMGAEGFNQRIRLHGMNETNTVIVRNALALRITDS